MKAFLVGCLLCAAIAVLAFIIAPYMEWPSAHIFANDATRL